MVITKADKGERPERESATEQEGKLKDKSPDWLLKHMPSLPLFQQVKTIMCTALRQVKYVMHHLYTFFSK